MRSSAIKVERAGVAPRMVRKASLYTRKGRGVAAGGEGGIGGLEGVSRVCSLRRRTRRRCWRKEKGRLKGRRRRDAMVWERGSLDEDILPCCFCLSVDLLPDALLAVRQRRPYFCGCWSVLTWRPGRGRARRV